MIVVISDIHLGADPAYAEIHDNLDTLEVFLEKIRESRNVKELVIGGDLLDEWYIPATTDTYDGGNQADFVSRIAAANRGVIDKFNQIISERKILVSYVPGNHDMAISAENINLILPGLNQVRDAAGVGTYSPAGHPEIAIEHGHRYNIIAAPDPVSNQGIAHGTILPPGYFFTRLAVLHFLQGCMQSTDAIKQVTPDISSNESQKLLYGYWQSWAWWLNMLPIDNHFNEKMIATNVDGFSGNFSVDDLIPYQDTPGGEIKVRLYDGIQDTWAERCLRNSVDVPIPTADAFKYASESAAGTDIMAEIQYFSNPHSTKRIVIFGHTHVAKILKHTNYGGLESIYANSGTWVDENPNGTKLDFIVITPQDDRADSKTRVSLYNFSKEQENMVIEESVKL